MLNKTNQVYYDAIGLEHRPYESSFSKAVLISSVILDTLLHEPPPKCPISKTLQNRPSLLHKRLKK
ncbi:hypothetical protein EAH77_23000 [Ewingella americana]|uniref:Uncharacterized protein n=1 Tax=Ewingella americana TaxID=41202 RepID=A0A502G238_9GAMM|nr:hypothetical protein EAH77_23000 [Ewingella americana]